MNELSVAQATDSVFCRAHGCQQIADKDGLCSEHATHTTTVMRSIDELKRIAQAQDALALAAGARAVEHALRAGDALIEIRERLGHGAWHRWLEDNWGRSLNRAQAYMRLARFRPIIEAEKPNTITGATRLLVGMDDNRVDPSLKTRAQQLRDEGATWDEIASSLGRSAASIRRWLDPQQREHARLRAKHRSKKALREQRQEQRAAQVRACGGDVQSAYSLIRNAIHVLQAALKSEQNPEARKLFEGATNSLYNAEDKVVAASELAELQEAA